ncbi:MAG: hypothetical protein A2136_08370 [Chloroflexi bacterium RBG_16_54_11]|nr:MAG: hypothetical protein A2136_08370 [Chloroflexi bacterium RBG_16_54_11]
MSERLVFLKLGGSLITDKNLAHTPRLPFLACLAGEIAGVLAEDPHLRIVLGHGSGSFGHVPASKYQTRLGVQSPEEWHGFVEVWREAAELNHIVMHALGNAGLPALAFPPSAMLVAHQGKVVTWDLAPMQQALDRGLLPVIYGDTVFDTALGGTILSTEDLFAHLAQKIQPTRLLLAGDQPGVWADFPAKAHLLTELTPADLPQIEMGLGGSSATDVTGGMAGKVCKVLSMVAASPALRACIFSGEKPGNVRRALLGEPLGTEIHS